MKRKVLFLFVAIMTTTSLLACTKDDIKEDEIDTHKEDSTNTEGTINKDASSNTEDDIPKEYEYIGTDNDYVQFNYDELKDVSLVIAMVEIEDDVNVDNSIFLYDETEHGGYLVGYYSMRTAKVIDYYKNEKKSEDLLKFIEPTAVDEDVLLVVDGYEPLEKGNRYIVFLSDETASGDLSIISAQNGVVSFEGINESQYFEIAIKSIVEYGSNLDEDEKNKLLEAEIIKGSSEMDDPNVIEREIEIDDLQIIIHYMESEDKENAFLVYVEE